MKAFAANALVLAVFGLAVCVDAQVQGATPREQSPAQAQEPAQDQAEIPIRLPQGKKLVLADGSFQMVREYSVQGERVRYWSVERSAWEEIPTSLVDWEATRQAEADQTKRDAELKQKIRASDLAERTRGIDVDRSLEIKPALFLPDDAGFFLLEDKTIISMKQSLAETSKSKMRELGRILSGIPLPGKQTMELPGARAAIRVSTSEPEFFMRPVDRREPRMQLLRLQQKGDSRIVQTIDVYNSGQQVRSSTDIAFQTWTPATGVFRYTMNERLEPGEYAFVEITSEGVNAYVWDFAIDVSGQRPVPGQKSAPEAKPGR